MARPTPAELIDEAPLSRLQIVVVALCITVSLLDGFDTQAIAFVAPSIARQWSVSQFQFGFIFSATLLGSVIGSAIGGVLADRIGRRKLVIATTALFGLLTGACALAASYEQLLVFRLLGGIGMGGVIPNMIALASEYAPERRRATIVTFTLWGFPFGAVLGGIAAGPLIARFGWPAVFWAGAAAPLLLVPLLIVWLPESLRFLGLQEARREEMRRLLHRIDPARAGRAEIEPPRDFHTRERGHIRALFRSDLGRPALLISMVMFLSLFLTYLLLNWVPTLLAQAGMSDTQAILGAVALNLGGIAGSYGLARLLDRRPRPAIFLAGGYACAAIAIGLASRGTSSAPVALALLLLCGFFHIGTQLSTTAYSSGIFPVALRGTALGLIQAIGRTGSLIGPVVGGALLSLGLTTADLFRLAMLPAALCAVALYMLSRETTG